MPELPEVETVRRGVAAFAGHHIAEVAATGVRSMRRYPDPRGFEDRCRGQVLDRVGRHGKYLILELSGGDAVIVHLGMSGQLLRAPAGAPAQPHTHVVWDFDDGPQLRFVDPRTFGEVFLTRPDDGGTIPELAALGPDALDGLPSWRDLRAAFNGRRTRLKPLLLDQHCVAGIGNIYADEILFAARLGGDRPADSLKPAEIGRLHEAIGTILATAVAHRGSSLADAEYRDVDGVAGDFQLQHCVYGREGRPCRRCGRPIVRRREGGRSSFSCDRCQRRAGIPDRSGRRH